MASSVYVGSSTEQTLECFLVAIGDVRWIVPSQFNEMAFIFY